MTRVILDAHIPGPVVGAALERRGQDVFSVDRHPDLEGLSDRDLLSLAAAEGRVLVTANVRHFLPLLMETRGQDEPHAGCILVPRSIRSEDFGALIRTIAGALEGVSQEEWVGQIKWIRKSPRE